MSKRLFAAIASLAVLGLAASAVPAFTADSGTVTVSVTAQAPPAPCLTVTPDNLDFGTLPFEKPGDPTPTRGAAGPINLTNCGTVPENLNVSATNAAGPSGSWELHPFIGRTCGLPDNTYKLAYYGSGLPLYSQPNAAIPITTQSAPVLGQGGDPALFAPTVEVPMTLEITMPCQGSNGAGETKTLSVVLTAVIP